MSYLTYNGKYVLSNGQYLVQPTAGPGTITMTVTGTGDFLFWLAGNGEDANVNWGDGNDQDIVLDPGYNEMTHTFSTTPNTIVVTGAENVTEFWEDDWSDFVSTSIDIDAGCVAMEWIYLEYDSGTKVGEFTTHPEWVNLKKLQIDGGDWTGLTNLDTYAEWTALEVFELEDVSIPTIETHAEWTELFQSTFNRCDNITSIETHNTWTKLDHYQLWQCPSINSTQTHAEWTDMRWYRVYQTPVTAVETHPEWTALEIIEVTDTSITSFETHPEWTLFRTARITNNAITSFIVHTEWTPLSSLWVNGAAITSDTIINNMLIACDTLVMGTGDDIDFSGGTNATPTGAGATAKSNLQVRNCTVTTN